MTLAVTAIADDGVGLIQGTEGVHKHMPGTGIGTDSRQVGGVGRWMFGLVWSYCRSSPMMTSEIVEKRDA